MSKFLQYVAASYPIIWVNTIEYQRAIANLSKTVKKIGHKPLKWDIQNGLIEINTGKIIKGEEGDPAEPINYLHNKEKNIVFAQDFHLWLKSPEIWRKLLNKMDSLKENANVFVIVSPVVDIPAEINRYITVVDFTLPNREELNTVLTTVCNDMEVGLPGDQEREEIINCGLGLTTFEFENSLYLSISSVTPFTKTVQAQKEQLIRKNSTLSISNSEGGFETLAGLDNLKTFAKKMATARGAKRGKGVLLLGVPGAGKSHFAKTLGKETGRVTINMDFGNLMGGIVGETEQKTRDALAVIDAMEPCILFIDEIEKGLAGTSGHNGDSGTSKRQGGMFLKWLNDHDSDVYVVATSNSINELPPEFLRAERWDAIFFVDLPNDEERNAILNIYRNFYKIAENDIEIPDIEGWTGAEIRSMCRLASSMEISLMEASQYICPILKTMGEKIDALRDFAKDRAIPASLLKQNTLKLKRKTSTRRTISTVEEE